MLTRQRCSSPPTLVPAAPRAALHELATVEAPEGPAHSLLRQTAGASCSPATRSYTRDRAATLRATSSHGRASTGGSQASSPAHSLAPAGRGRVAAWRGRHNLISRVNSSRLDYRVRRPAESPAPLAPATQRTQGRRRGVLGSLPHPTAPHGRSGTAVMRRARPASGGAPDTAAVSQIPARSLGYQRGISAD